MEFSTTLLREKFIIRDGRGEHISGVPVVAVSNRIVVPLHSKSGQIHETFVVRAYSMHLCVRMAAKIAQTFQRSGPLMAREQKFDFEEAWDSMTEDHESRFTPQKWIVIYNAGKPIFISGEHPAFLDMIEKCDAANPGNYDGSIHLAEDMLAKLGREVTITHDANIGLVVSVRPGACRCGLIFRNPNRQTTFNFMAEDKGEAKIGAYQCLSTAAAYLEGIQLGFRIGAINAKLYLGIVSSNSAESKEADSGRKRLARLNVEIQSFENLFSVHYRPEKPSFSSVIEEAESFTRSLRENK